MVLVPQVIHPATAYTAKKGMESPTYIHLNEHGAVGKKKTSARCQNGTQIRSERRHPALNPSSVQASNKITAFSPYCGLRLILGLP